MIAFVANTHTQALDALPSHQYETQIVGQISKYHKHQVMLTMQGRDETKVAAAAADVIQDNPVLC